MVRKSLSTIVVLLLMSASARRFRSRRMGRVVVCWVRSGLGLTRSGLSGVIDRIAAVVGVSAQAKVGVEAAGHYHRPVLKSQLDRAFPR
jgi:hypothetical protein